MHSGSGGCSNQSIAFAGQFGRKRLGSANIDEKIASSGYQEMQNTVRANK